MFLCHLDPGQRKSLLIMAFNMIVADRAVRDEEKGILDALKHELGIAQVAKIEADLGPELSLFQCRRSKIAVMLKLASIAYSDREFHDREIKVLVRYGREMHLSAADMKAIDDWGRKHQALVNDAERLLDHEIAATPAGDGAGDADGET